jgi:ABC-2 type transport system permease protein
MINDVATVIWKEWKELIARSTQSRAEMRKTIAVGIVILGIIIWRSAFLANNLASLAVPTLVLMQFLAGIMADSFAGERERHTLETLLASRLSDLSILIGKILAGVLLVSGLMLSTVGLGVLSAYVQGAARVTISVTDVVAIFGLYLLVCTVVSCAAVLVSLRASTVRQAIQTLAWSMMILFFLSIFALSRLTPDWRVTLFRAMAGEHLLRTEIIAAAILSGLVAILFAAARLRFQRARLILD